MESRERDYDVIVIGSGTAGMSAAVEAAGAGARVLLCEAGDRLGGSSAASGGLFLAAGTEMQRRQGVEDSADALFEHFMAINKYEVEPAIVRRFVDEGPGAIEWLKSLGVEFKDEVIAVGQSKTPRGHVPKLYGFGHTQALEAACSRKGVEIALLTRVEEILVDGAGRVRGIRAGNTDVSCHAVVIACGGLGNAPADVKKQYIPISYLDPDWHFYIGVKTNLGDVIKLGTKLGAEIVGQNCGVFMNVGRKQEFIEGPQPGWPVWVNKFGRRFIDEESDYSIIPWLVARQPDQVFFGIMDQDGFEHEKLDPRYRFKNIFDDAGAQSWEPENMSKSFARGAIVKADTLEELGAKIGLVNPAALAVTIAEYNADAAAGRDSHYLKNPRWLIPIVKPPFYAFERRLGQISATQVGLRINVNAQVYRTDGGYVPGLYAAGESAGGIFTHYVGSGVSIGNCVVYGRTAGRNAAAERMKQAGARTTEGAGT